MNFSHNDKNMTPEQYNLWRHVKTLMAFDSDDTLTPLVYQGLIAGSEFETYNAKKLYICFSFVVAGLGPTANQPTLLFYDESNVANIYLNNVIAWFEAARVYMGNNAEMRNFYFSRLVTTEFSRMSFNGFRLNKLP